MAEIAFVFHWPLSDLQAMEVDDLVKWRNLAIAQWNRANEVKQ